jgi:hypothetical protein
MSEEPNGAAPEEDAPDDLELFPLGSLEGDAKKLTNVFRGNLPVEVTVSVMAAEVPVREGLIDFERPGKLLVSYDPHQVVVVAKRENDRLVGYKARQVLRPSYVEGVGANAGQVEAAFVALLQEDPAEAGRLLDTLRERAEAALQTA